MKKKLVLTLVILLGSFVSNAQNIYYFDVDFQPYQSLNQQGVTLNENNIWDEPKFAVPLGFEFFFFDARIDTLFTGDGIGAFLHNLPKPELTPSESNRFIVPYETDLQDRGALAGTDSESPIVFRWEGFPGQRIFKMEWANAGFFDEREEYGTMNDFVNIQLWIYEATSVIEFHYGESQISDPIVNFFGLNGPTIGIMSSVLSLPIVLIGDPESPDLTNDLSVAVGLDATPPSGTVYRFTPDLETVNPISSNSIIEPNFSIIQNQQNQQISILSEQPQLIKLYNLNGQLLDSKHIHQHSNWDMSLLSPGMYLLQDEQGGVLRFVRF